MVAYSQSSKLMFGRVGSAEFVGTMNNLNLLKYSCQTFGILYSGTMTLRELEPVYTIVK